MSQEALWGWYPATNTYKKLQVDAAGRLVLDPTLLFEDTPTDGELEKAPTSNWAYDLEVIVAGKSKVVWLDTEVLVVNDINRTTTLAWTDCDISAYVSANTKMAILACKLKTDSYVSNFAYLGLRKNGTTPTYFTQVFMNKVAGHFETNDCITGLDAGKVFEYYIYVGGTSQHDTNVVLLGYIE